MSRRTAHLTVLSIALVTACTTDFTAYHLESSAASAGADSLGGALGVASSTATDGGSSGSGTISADGGKTSASGGVSSAAGTEQRRSGTSSTDAAGSGDGDTPTLPPSCVGLASTCGPNRSASCCDSSSVPAGTYYRSAEAAAPATVSTFALDDYETTVGRFRSFVTVYSPTMTTAGAGKNPNNAALDPGWDSAWNTVLPASAAALATALQCPSGTYTPSPGRQ